ncbi:acetyltransferase [uncultured Marinococcus sp.]|uniref:acetyltransferase n=1 Tax=uncultured Marinococcus sp. TaxID=487012 RepID=UPI002631AA79|nr:acetyltransferase [uncultured Marinococcus sp.]
MINVILIGDGGHSRVIQSMIEEHLELKLKAIVDMKFKEYEIKNQVMHVPFEKFSILEKNNSKFCIAIGNNRTRKKIIEDLLLNTDDFVTIIDKSAVVKSNVLIGKGTVIMPNAVINPNTIIGNHSIINTGAIVEHDNKLDNYTHISPGSVLTGGVTVKEGAQVASGATIIPNITVGEWAVLGAGSTAINDLPAYSKAVGSPAKQLKN